MAIIGTHMLFYTPEAEALRRMLRDAFGFKAVDAGEGWLIFGLPPAELGVHPLEGSANDSVARHQVTFMCDDLHKTIAQLRAKGVRFEGEPQQQNWGTVAMMILPGELKVMLYQPRHKMAIPGAKARATKQKPARRTRGRR